MNGRLEVIKPATTTRFCPPGGRCLADAATAPLPAAATATAATTAAAAPAAPAAAATATAAPAPTTAASTPSDLVTKLRLGTLLVEDIEGRQADVGKLFLAEDDFVSRRGLLRGQVRHRCAARRGRGATRRTKASCCGRLDSPRAGHLIICSLFCLICSEWMRDARSSARMSV